MTLDAITNYIQMYGYWVIILVLFCGIVFEAAACPHLQQEKLLHLKKHLLFLSVLSLLNKTLIFFGPLALLYWVLMWACFLPI